MTAQISLRPGITVFTLLILSFIKVSSLDYKDLEDMDISCPSADSCVEGNDTKATEGRSCNCGPFCSRHNACCIDSPHKDLELPRTSAECSWIEAINTSVYIVNKCDPLWDGPERTRELCEQGIRRLNDPVSIIPVTNTQSGVSYANIFCSMCNWEGNDTAFWYFAVSHEETQYGKDNRQCAEIVPRALEYTNTRGEWEWGYLHRYALDKSKFVPVELHIRIPRDVQALVTRCFADITSECAEGWADKEVWQKCQSYMAAIEVPLQQEESDVRLSKIYKNVHCAHCNHETNLTNATCKLMEEIEDHVSFPDSYYKIVLFFPYQLPSIDCLLSIADIKPTDDDPQSRCRTVICDPGYKHENGKCMPQGT